MHDDEDHHHQPGTQRLQEGLRRVLGLCCHHVTSTPPTLHPATTRGFETTSMRHNGHVTATTVLNDDDEGTGGLKMSNGRAQEGSDEQREGNRGSRRVLSPQVCFFTFLHLIYCTNFVFIRHVTTLPLTLPTTPETHLGPPMFFFVFSSVANNWDNERKGFETSTQMRLEPY